MAGVARNPLQVSRDERRRLLAQHYLVVVEELIEGGESFHDMSVQRLLEAGSLSRATFYAYFEDKGDLLRSMADEVVGEFAEAGPSWWELDADAGLDDLRAALRPPFEVYFKNSAIMGAIIEAAAQDPRVREPHARLLELTADGLARHIEERQKVGRAAPVDAQRAAQWIVRMFERGLYELVATASKAERKRLLDAAAEGIWRWLYEGYRE